jgi:hypothetical protein
MTEFLSHLVELRSLPQKEWVDCGVGVRLGMREWVYEGSDVYIYIYIYIYTFHRSNISQRLLDMKLVTITNNTYNTIT